MRWVKSNDIAADLRRMRDEFGFRLTAAMLDRDAEEVDGVAWSPRAAVLIGNEWEGLAAECLALCHARATIAMRPGVDSLNLGVAAGVFLYHLCRR